MTKYIRDLRLIPIAVIACACLLALKAADLFLGASPSDNAPRVDTGASIIRTTPDVQQSSSSWATQMFNFPDGSGAAPTHPPVVAAATPADQSNLDITGSVPADAAAKAADKTNNGAADKSDKGTADKSTMQAKADPGKPPLDAKAPGTVIPLDGQPSGAERAILERLQERRQELDTRGRELDIRESLIKAAEKRMEGQLAELKETESRITVATQQKDEAQAARFKGLVIMYENMKPRDAAKIFDRLDMGVLLEVASKIEPRHMADIMAQMSADAAQRLTVELASQAQQTKPANTPSGLPKIEGQPTQ
jgi:flagellar motility protein MotE (MotC chaperone)